MKKEEKKFITIWFTSLFGPRKTTVSRILRDKLRERGITHVEILDSDVVIEYNKEKPEESADKIIEKLEEMGYLPKTSGKESLFSQEEEEKIKKRLKDLGYIE